MSLRMVVSSVLAGSISGCSSGLPVKAWDLLVTIDGCAVRIRTTSHDAFGHRSHYETESLRTMSRCIGVTASRDGALIGTLEEESSWFRAAVYDRQMGRSGSYATRERISLLSFSPDATMVALIEANSRVLLLRIGPGTDLVREQVIQIPDAASEPMLRVVWVDTHRLICENEDQGMWCYDLRLSAWRAIGEGRDIVRAPNGIAYRRGPRVCTKNLQENKATCLSRPNARRTCKAAVQGFLVSPCGEFLAYDVASPEGFTLGIERLDRHQLVLLQGVSRIVQFGAWIERPDSNSSRPASQR